MGAAMLVADQDACCVQGNHKCPQWLGHKCPQWLG